MNSYIIIQSNKIQRYHNPDNYTVLINWYN
jgi:hypothetical protein